MNLMTMQFGSFVFPVNPTELKLERACLLRETVGVDDAGTLLPGEVRLFSAGGAEIVLKLDGTVVINGQVFEKKEE